MVNCEPCPAGTECPLDGTVVPTLCQQGYYREATLPTQSFGDNVMCTPCPQGTWNNQGGLTSRMDCNNCDARYVCPLEGTTVFATIEMTCPANAGPDAICYENSQGEDCPQGYGCDISTAGFSKFDTFCEPGFWCKVRSTPRETRNLLCPPGYYCKMATGENGGSGRKAFVCPPDHFCPEGTGANTTRVGNRLLLLLANVQARLGIVTQINVDTGAMCRRCPDETPPGMFDLTLCRPCGQTAAAEILMDSNEDDVVTMTEFLKHAAIFYNNIPEYEIDEDLTWDMQGILKLRDILIALEFAEMTKENLVEELEADRDLIREICNALGEPSMTDEEFFDHLDKVETLSASGLRRLQAARRQAADYPEMGISWNAKPTVKVPANLSSWGVGRKTQAKNLTEVLVENEFTGVLENAVVIAGPDEWNLFLRELNRQHHEEAKRAEEEFVRTVVKAAALGGDGARFLSDSTDTKNVGTSAPQGAADVQRFSTRAAQAAEAARELQATSATAWQVATFTWDAPSARRQKAKEMPLAWQQLRRLQEGEGEGEGEAEAEAELDGDEDQAQLPASMTAAAAMNITYDVPQYDKIICAPDISVDPPIPWVPHRSGECYSSVRLWDVVGLKCPRGTMYPLGAKDPDDCTQIGELVAVVNIYKCYPPRPCAMKLDGAWRSEFQPAPYKCKIEEALCGIEEIAEKYKDDANWKKAYLWGKELMDNGKYVRFLGIDPMIDIERYFSRPFTNISMKAVQIAYLEFDFRFLNSFTRLNAGGAGHFAIHIHSNFIAPEMALEGHTLPPFYDRSVNSRMHDKFVIKIMALQDLNFSVWIDLRHGGHKDYMDGMNETLDIKVYSPSRSIFGKPKFFCAVLSQELLLGGAFELPYNMPPGSANTPGEMELVIDAQDTAGKYNAPNNVREDGDKKGLLNVMSPGTAFWSSKGLETVSFPWLPFFSNCDGFDSHIHIWELLENPGYQNDGTREGCDIVDYDKLKVVPPFPLDFSTMEMIMEPNADACDFITQCRFEEGLEESDYASKVWFAIGEESMTIYYITTNPISVEEYQMGEDFFAPLVGTDDLLKVKLNAPGRKLGARIPRKIIFEIGYYQRSTDVKSLVGADIHMSEFDEDIVDEHYSLNLKFGALTWNQLMNGFQLPYEIYVLLYCVIGLGAVAFTLGSWMILRAVTRKAEVPPFRFAECYEFFLYWPFQGVLFATVPLIVVCSVIKFNLHPAFGGASVGWIPCKWSEMHLVGTIDSATNTCYKGRTGTCFMIAGCLMLLSGAKLIVPRLREVEEQFLLQQPSAMLNREGLPIPQEQRALIRSVPIRWKRGHLIFVSIMLLMPLTMMWEFTYCSFFGANALHFIMGFNFAMVSVDGALSRSVREELLQVPLSTACSVVLFIGTLGANDFVDFCEGFFIELLIGIVDRLVLVFVFRYIGEARAAFIHWVKTRAWLWQLLLFIVGDSPRAAKWLMTTEPEEDEDEAEEEEVEGTPIEEAMEEILGCGTASMSTITSPFLIAMIIVFADETRVPDMYGIRRSDLVNYLLFGLVVAPFQVMMDILMNHATEIAHGVQIYDYMLYAKFRWRNRLTQWLFDDPRMDESVAEPLQSVNHLCFSPQFYFIETYYTWGILLVMVAMTILIRWDANPFEDPALAIFIVQQVICNRVMDALTQYMIFTLLWKPKNNSVFRVFNKNVAISLQKKDSKIQQDKYRMWFMHRHTGWLVGRMGEIFSPRSRDRYRSKLSLLYQQALMLQPPHVYKVPGPAFPPAVAREELPPALQDELEEDSSSDEEVRPATSILMQPFAQIGLAETPGGWPALPSMPGRPGTAGSGSSFGGPLATLPMLPQAPSDVAAPPWPISNGEDDEFVSGGVTMLTALIGRAWLATLRRRNRMRSIAECLEEDWPLADKCFKCGAQDEADFVRRDCTGIYDNGAQNEIAETEGDIIETLIMRFEDFSGVPPLPLDEEQWYHWLERYEPFCTLCIKCRTAREEEALALQDAARSVKPFGAAMQALPGPAGAGAVALPAPPPSSASQMSKARQGSKTSSFGGDASGILAVQDDDEAQFSDSESDDEFGAEEDDEPFPELKNLKVDPSSREMLLYWALQARKRLNARNRLVTAQRIEEEMRREDEGSEEDEESDYNDEGSEEEESEFGGEGDEDDY